jgi:hypothetical protein
MNSILLIALLASPPRDVRRWTPADTTLELGLVALTAYDVLNTRAALKAGIYVERNPLDGVRPTLSRLLVVSAVELGAHAAIAYVLPKPWRRLWQYVGICVEAGNLVDNWAVGGSFAVSF